MLAGSDFKVQQRFPKLMFRHKMDTSFSYRVRNVMDFQKNLEFFFVVLSKLYFLNLTIMTLRDVSICNFNYSITLILSNRLRSYFIFATFLTLILLLVFSVKNLRFFNKVNFCRKKIQYVKLKRTYFNKKF